MEEKILPIGIDSEIEHVTSEIDRIDGMFTVPTGPMGHQEVNYHIIDDERDYHTTQQLFSHTKSISEFPKENLSLKSLLSALPYQYNAEFLDSEILNEYQDDISNKWIQNKISDNYDRKTRFSLPEIDVYDQQEKKFLIKKINNSLKYIRKEQPISNLITNSSEIEEQKLSSSFFLNESTIEIPEHCRPDMNNILQQQVETLLPFYTFNELAEHNDSTDAWICIFSYIYDITSLIQKTKGTRVHQLLIDYAGQDISSWFDEQLHKPRKRIDPHTNESVLLIKDLSIIETFGTPFWQTKDLLIGRLIEHPRYIRLIHNFSPKHSYLLEIAEEETIGQIAKKFLKYNSHIFSYIWLYNGKKLDFNKTLTENGIPNEEFFHDTYGWRSDNENCPTILLFFSDDLTIA
ncbi:unnamed protein product [Rotaria sordida]|uniref:Cytochrome b5 domain-containing protein 1 n=1 Tax=Rotaria sordida TaxID=392033 RepID=A0A819E2M8_9BILA|nr:unnamed protein product [Rotaria sordida]CAF1316429.1 unnamed protein product [Rotaria sordida]CAF3843328.1 unnamed protein product [Rotaria sordida]